jgi:hypothetical protein
VYGDVRRSIAVAMLCLWPLRMANAVEEIEGEIGAAVSAGVQRNGAVLGGDARTGLYFTRARAVPMLVGNRIGFDLRVRALYGRDESGAFIGDYLAGVAPSLTHQFEGTGRFLTGWRATTLSGLALPEPGVWLRSNGPALFFLAWRAQITWLPEGEAGLELVPAFVWAPRGAVLGTLSLGGFMR